MSVSATAKIACDSSTIIGKDGAIPSVFVAKLFQMVNGSPDDVVTVSRTTSFYFKK
jgi:hypothetical protein